MIVIKRLSVHAQNATALPSQLGCHKTVSSLVQENGVEREWRILNFYRYLREGIPEDCLGLKRTSNEGLVIAA
jgi:hypothetical protein